jgi:nucleoside-diphosphate-sugar epimerase
MILVTGGYGCIGAQAVKWLLRNTDADVLVGSRKANEARTERVFHDVDRSRLTCIELNVSDQGRLQEVLSTYEITQVAHMAALQTPDCNAYRDLGLQINLAGTQNLIEAMKASDQSIKRFVFASSIAIYGPRVTYPEGRVPMLAEPQPVNVYGAWKLAGEQISKFFCDDAGVPTVSLRPGVLFGPGRDAGLTSSPTTAMKCVALGLPYEIPFRSRQDYQYAPDVGAAVCNALLEPFDGYGVFTLPSRSLETSQIVEAMQQAADEVGLAKQFQITIGADEVPFICDLEYDPFLKAFPRTPHTSFEPALRESLNVFKTQVDRGWLSKSAVATSG